MVYKAILDSSVPISLLKMKIPDSLCSFYSTGFIKYNFETDSLDIERENFVPRTFIDEIVDVDKNIYGHECDDKDPAAISHDQFDEQIVFDWDMVRDKAATAAGNTVV